MEVNGFATYPNVGQRQVNYVISFFEFRALSDKKDELYQVDLIFNYSLSNSLSSYNYFSKLPESVFCEEQTEKEPFPNFPKTFSFYTQTIVAKEKQAFTNQVIDFEYNVFF